MPRQAGGARGPTPANRFSWDYGQLARRGEEFGLTYRGPILDAHAHIGGQSACQLWLEEARAFGVDRVYSMVRLDEARRIAGQLGNVVRFIAFPNFRGADRGHAMREGFLEDIRAFHAELGSRVVKLWNSPRLREVLPPEDHAGLVELDAPWRVKAAELAQELGMVIMAHVADPDTWFATKYRDRARFGAKRDHYRGLEVMLRRFPGPWIAAHMGGSPEDLGFLSGLLERHSNLYLDTSATKWVVRELSRHPIDDVRAFFRRWRGRLLFGSDVVTLDEHLGPVGSAAAKHPMADLADSPESARELYASRYAALRLLFESRYDGESPIADADLALVEPGSHDAMSAPRLRGLGLDRADLEWLYEKSARRVLGA